MAEPFHPIVSPRTRTCGVCARTLPLDPARPGWTPTTHEGHAVWACPACSRAGHAARP